MSQLAYKLGGGGSMSAIFLVLISVNCEILLTIITAIKKERQWPNLMKNMKIVKKK